LEYVSSSAPIEDAFWYLEAAAGVVEGSRPEVTPWDVPVWTQLARVWLRAFGASLASAHALGAAVSWLTVLCLWRLVRSCFGARAALAAAATLSVLAPFVALGRTPLIYGPVTLVLLTAAALFVSGRRRPAWQRLGCEAAAWALVAGAVVSVRPPAAALAGGFVAVYFVRSARPLRTLWVLCGWVTVGALLAWVFLPDFVGSTVYRLRLQAGAGASPLELAWRLLRLFGDAVGYRVKEAEVGAVPFVTSGSGYGRLAWGALLAAAAGAILAARRWRDLSPGRQQALALLAGWLGTFALACAAMDARPLRYFPLIAPPIAALAGLAVALLPAARRQQDSSVPQRVAAASVGGLVASHLLDALLTGAGEGVPAEPRAWAALGAAAVVGGVVVDVLRGRRLSPPTRRVAAVLLLALATGPGLGRCVRDVLWPGFSVREANRVLDRLVGPDACLVGPHASYLAIGSGRRRLRAPWLRTRPPGVEPSLERLIELGATHVALGAGQAASASFAASLAIHGAPVELVSAHRTPFGLTLLYRLGWATTLGYELSDFERRRRGDAQGQVGAEPEPSLLEARVRALIQEDDGEAIQALMASTPLTPGARRALAGN
jgi:4-amino-4-deoxy-L-arabinose transferase-like glycosyltransferase